MAVKGQVGHRLSVKDFVRRYVTNLYEVVIRLQQECNM